MAKTRRTVFRTAAAVVVVVLAIAAIDAALGWPLAYRVAIALFYRHAALDASRIVRDRPYLSVPGSNGSRLRYDLYLPEGRGWPMVVFAPGGGWTEGNKDLTVGGADVYGNIGRYLAAHGIGTAVIDYRLVPSVSWRVQVADVAHAVVAARADLVARGARPASLFLMGHSAGAQLVTRVALDPAPLRDAGAKPGLVCGVIPVSGAALDLTDQRTWDLGADPDYYQRRFADKETRDWRAEPSPMRFVRPGAPPFLVIYAGGDSQPLRRQSERLAEALREAEVPVFLLTVPGSSHERIVLWLSREDEATQQIVRFVTTLRCWGER